MLKLPRPVSSLHAQCQGGLCICGDHKVRFLCVLTQRPRSTLIALDTACIPYASNWKKKNLMKNGIKHFVMHRSTSEFLSVSTLKECDEQMLIEETVFIHVEVVCLVSAIIHKKTVINVYYSKLKKN